MDLSFFGNNLSFFIFLGVLLLFLYLKRKHLHLNGSFPSAFILMYRTRLGLDKMDRWSKNHPKVFLYLAYLSIFIGVVGMFGVVALIIYQFGFIIENNLTSGGGLVLPIQTESGTEGSLPIFYVPFWYWILSIFVLIVVHEFAHGVIAERFGIKVKSSGLAFFGSVIVGLIIILYNIAASDIISLSPFALNFENFTLKLLIYLIIGVLFMFIPAMPGAFVEPDEKSLEEKPRWQKIAVYGAGSTSNFIFGGLFLLMWIFLAIPLQNSTMAVTEINFSNVMNESSLSDYNISSGSIIAFNNITDKNIILQKFQNMSVNESINLTLQTDNGTKTFLVNTFENPNVPGDGMIGISGIRYDVDNKEGFEMLGNIPTTFERLLFYLWFLNIGIGIMNLLPIWITDGGQIARTLLEKYFGEKRGIMFYNFVSLFSFVLIILTIWPGILISIIS